MQLLDENRWYNFDDAHISPINEEDVKSAAAYVLFYRRVKTVDAISNGENSGIGHNNGSSLKWTSVAIPSCQISKVCGLGAKYNLNEFPYF